MCAAVEALVDLSAIEHNVGVLRRTAGSAQVMAVVKGEAYGHGLVESARAAQASGATWLGTAVVDEALRLRAAGIEGPILAWLHSPTGRWREAVEARIDLSVGAPWMLDRITAAVQETDTPARVHLELDSGMGRGGCTRAQWVDLVEAALKAQASGHVDVVGLWSHFADAEALGSPKTARQLDVFREALDVAERLGVQPEVRHLANSAATFLTPSAHFDLVRSGCAVFGISPLPAPREARTLGLEPAMTLRTRIASVKRVPAGEGVSYAPQYITVNDTTLGIVPVGFADGIPRAASNVGRVFAGGRRRYIAGNVCMDQFIVDFGDDPVELGDEVVLFGPGHRGEPTLDDWAEALGTIPDEVVSRLTHSRIERRYVRTPGGAPQAPAPIRGRSTPLPQPTPLPRTPARLPSPTR